MTSRSYFGKMNSTLGSVVPLAIFVFLNVFTSRIKIYQNPHWKNNFSQLMTQLFMFDQTRASKAKVCAVIIRGAISHQGENFPIVSCWMFFVFLGYCQGFSHYFLVIFFGYLQGFFYFFCWICFVFLGYCKGYPHCCSFSFWWCGNLFISKKPNSPKSFFKKN